MKKMTKLVLAVLVAGFVFLGIPKAYAADDSIAVTVTLASTVSVDVLPTSWSLSDIALNTTNDLITCTATNNGNVTESFTIKGADGLNGWTNGAAVGLDTFKVLAGASHDGTSWDIAVTNTPGSVLAASVAQNVGQDFQVRYVAPSSDDQGGGTVHGFAITVTATGP